MRAWSGVLVVLVSAGCVEASGVPPTLASGSKVEVPTRDIAMPDGQRFAGCPEHTVLRGYPVVADAFATYCVTEIEPARRQGPFLSYYPSGKPLAKGWYQEGNPDGDWVTFHENGQTLSQGAYVRGTRHGAWKWSRDDGKPLLEETVNLGERTAWTEYDYDRGALTAFESFVAQPGKRPLSQGRAGFVHENGNLLAGSFMNDKGEGVWEERMPKEHLVVRLRMVNGFAEGRAEVLWPESDSPSAQGELLRTLPQGPWELYFPTGKKRAELVYYKGILHGIHARHSNGEKQLEASFVDGVPDGKWTTYHPDGSVRTSGAFARGARQGMWRTADEQGKTLAEGLYDQGLLIEGQAVAPIVWTNLGLEESLQSLLKDIRAITTGRGSVESEQRGFAECMLLGDPAEKCAALDWENFAAFHAKDDAAAIDRRNKQQELACSMNNPAACARVGKRLEAGMSEAKDRKKLAHQVAGLYQKACDLAPLESVWRARSPAGSKGASAFRAAEACVWLGQMLGRGEVKSKAQTPADLFKRACDAGVESGCSAQAAAPAKGTAAAKGGVAAKAGAAAQAGSAVKKPGN